MAEKTLGIIGTGVSGLCAGKYGKENNFKITLFEKHQDVGGIWEPKSGYTWDNLRTNNSKYTFQFSDFPVKDDINSQDFLSNKEVQNYLKNYAITFKVYENILFSSLVIDIEKEGDLWKITYKNTKTDEIKNMYFDNIIVATGFYNVPKLDQYSEFIRDNSNSRIKFLHSSEYKNADLFKDKNVCIVGSSFSGSQIAVEIAKSAKSVINLLRRPYWFLNKNMNHNVYKKQLPNDFTVFSRSMFNESVTPKMRNSYYSQISIQNKIKELEIKGNLENPIKIVLADDYIESIEKGSIKIINGTIANIKNNTININNSDYNNIDYVIFCTGYKSELNFLGTTINKVLDYNPNINDFPLNLYNCTFNPNLKSFACVGVFLGSFTGSAEIQARYAIRYLSNMLDLNMNDIKNHLESENSKRKKPNYQLPNYAISNYVSFCDRLAKEMNIMPDLNLIRFEDFDLYNLLFNGPIIQAEYTDNLDKIKKTELKKILSKHLNPKF